MSLFNTALGLITSTDAYKTASSYVVTGAAEKVKEGTSKVLEVLGVDNPLSKLGSALPTVDSLVDTAFRGGTSDLTSNPFITEAMQAIKDKDKKLSAADAKSATGSAPAIDDHQVRLEEIGAPNVVIFQVMPEIVESHSVQYEAVAPSQSIGAFQKFKGTDSTQWTLNVTFIARNTYEATENLQNLNLLRGWTKPFFGNKTVSEYPGKLGAPPPVLRFSGLREKLVGPVPVVITALNWNWPKDVDYLPTQIPSTGADASSGGFIPFPAVMDIQIQLIECLSTNEFNRFSLAEYRNGTMVSGF